MTRRKTIIALLCVAIVSALGWYLYSQRPGPSIIFPRNEIGIPPVASPTLAEGLKPNPTSYEIPMRTHAFQTFNNCGPATLSMQLSYSDIHETQQTLGQKLRPFQNPQGNNDDKSTTLEELAAEALNYNLVSFHRPGGDVELLKRFIANDIPVVLRTWLHPNEDIGHFRLVRGYDDNSREFIQDDSYENKNLRYDYDTMLAMWQPFNYEYLVIVKPEQQMLVEKIIGEDIDTPQAWQRVLANAQVEHEAQPTNPYPAFNQSVAQYHLGNYAESIKLYESVATQLPYRMLWYQTEPIEAYLEAGNYDRVFSMTQQILSNNNRSYTELYILRGRAYEAQGNRDAARAEYEKAVLYNVHNQAAKDALESVQ